MALLSRQIHSLLVLRVVGPFWPCWYSAPMGWLKVVVGLFAILNIGGGIEGYISKGSVPSIISGSVAGILLLLGLFVATNNTRIGYGICAVVAFGDLGFFTMQLTKGKGFWPAGV